MHCRSMAAVGPRLRGRKFAGHLLAGLLVLLAVVGCSSVAESTPIATWPVPVERLPAAIAASADPPLTCGGRTFPASVLEAETGAERSVGPAFDALRASLARFGPEIQGSQALTWRLAAIDATGAIFVARADVLGSDNWISVEVVVDPNGWQPSSMGDCYLYEVISPEFGPATWALDPAYARPSADMAELHILVWERACSGGAPTTGRMSAPVIAYAVDTVTITIGVRPIAGDGIVTCPGPQGTPASLDLAEALGDRTLLDGGHVPAAAPSPMF
jgi:hypothetical protein